MEKVIIYTTAESGYDWFGTTEVEADAGKARNGKKIRKVEIEAGRAGAQCDRYASGLHMAADAAEWEKLVRFGLVTIAAPEAAAPTA